MPFRIFFLLFLFIVPTAIKLKGLGKFIALMARPLKMNLLLRLPFPFENIYQESSIYFKSSMALKLSDFEVRFSAVYRSYRYTAEKDMQNFPVSPQGTGIPKNRLEYRYTGGKSLYR